MNDAEAGKQEGMARAARHANKQWMLEMTEHAVAVARERVFFTADDVFLRAAIVGMASRTHEHRAFGPIMLRLAKANICCKANCLPINSRRRSKHAGPMTVWQSLVCDWLR